MKNIFHILPRTVFLKGFSSSYRVGTKCFVSSRFSYRYVEMSLKAYMMITALQCKVAIIQFLQKRYKYTQTIQWFFVITNSTTQFVCHTFKPQAFINISQMIYLSGHIMRIKISCEMTMITNKWIPVVLTPHQPVFILHKPFATRLICDVIPRGSEEVILVKRATWDIWSTAGNLDCHVHRKIFHRVRFYANNTGTATWRIPDENSFHCCVPGSLIIWFQWSYIITVLQQNNQYFALKTKWAL